MLKHFSLHMLSQRSKGQIIICHLYAPFIICNNRPEFEEQCSVLVELSFGCFYRWQLHHLADSVWLHNNCTIPRRDVVQQQQLGFFDVGTRLDNSSTFGAIF